MRFLFPEHATVVNLEQGQIDCDIEAGPSQISIVITTYNDSHFLAEAVESALAQTVRPREIIVVDDGSVDDPASVVARYPKVRLISQPNQGLSAARNTGWRAATGRYVVFLDADDRLRPDALRSNLQLFSEKPECALVHGGYVYLDTSGEQTSLPLPALIGEDPYESLLKGNCIAMHATVMYRRDRLEEEDGFDTQLLACEDYDLYLRLARRHRIASGTDRIAEYRRHDSNMSLNFLLMLDAALMVLNRQAPNLRNNKQWQNAFKTGVRNFKSTYVQAQLSQAKAISRRSGLKHVPWLAITRMLARAPGTVIAIGCRSISRAMRRAQRLHAQ